MRRASVPLLTTLVVLTVLPSAAAADTFYASPSGSGTVCSEADPCWIEDALSQAILSDDVVQAGPGTYDLGTDGLIVSRTLKGTPGAETVITSTRVHETILLFGGVLSDVEVRNTNPGALRALAMFEDSTAERVSAVASGQIGCMLFPEAPGPAVTNSLCVGSTVAGIEAGTGTPGDLAVSLRGVTAVGPTGIDVYSDDMGGGSVSLDARNTIALGTTADVRAQEPTGPGHADTIVTLTGSNYDTLHESGSVAITAPGSGSNQTAEPRFASPGTLDFHQAPRSPTIDAGQGAGGGPFDFEGEPRVQGAAPDIGADEARATCKGRFATLVATVGSATVGTSGNDVIAGTNSRDVIRSRGGRDIVCGLGGADRINGGGGSRDKLLGQEGNDRLAGGGGRRDKCVGGPGRDRASRSCERASGVP